MKSSKRSLEDLTVFVDRFVPTEIDDDAAVRALRQGLTAASAGTYGVGAVIMDSAGRVVCEGGNGVHLNGFHSDLHAEMVALNEFEAKRSPGDQSASSHTLVSTLEPCPMCMTRLIFSGLGRIRYLCPDNIGGMVQRKHQLPPVFLELTEKQGQNWGEARCSAPLRQVAFDVWNTSQELLDRKVVERSSTMGGEAAGASESGAE